MNLTTNQVVVYYKKVVSRVLAETKRCRNELHDNGNGITCYDYYPKRGVFHVAGLRDSDTDGSHKADIWQPLNTKSGAIEIICWRTFSRDKLSWEHKEVPTALEVSSSPQQGWVSWCNVLSSPIWYWWYWQDWRVIPWRDRNNRPYLLWAWILWRPGHR